MTQDISFLIQSALQEDLSTKGDLTSTYLIPKNSSTRANLVSRSEGVLSGLAVAKQVFLTVDPEIVFISFKNDSDRISPHQVIASVQGSTRSILAAERTALNFLQHLSGIATLTSKFVKLAQAGGAKIVDTRKTIPGLRFLQKSAVVHGGGHNHRMGLYDRILVKDNHFKVIGKDKNTLSHFIQRIRTELGNIIVEFEAETVEDAVSFAELGVDIVLLDNMNLDQIRDSVSRIQGRARTEASGGITLENVAEISQTGVDFISIGQLTHSAPALDIGLDFE